MQRFDVQVFPARTTKDAEYAMAYGDEDVVHVTAMYVPGPKDSDYYNKVTLLDAVCPRQLAPAVVNLADALRDLLGPGIESAQAAWEKEQQADEDSEGMSESDEELDAFSNAEAAE